ncbi:MAG TPA: hypothetical protein VF322_09125 [Gammaproteobacteria bacterium]
MAALHLPSLSAALAARGLGLEALGGAYLVALVNLAAAVAFFACARSYLVVTPNRAARNYGVYASAGLVTLLVATVLENELARPAEGALAYAAVPQLAALLALHVRLGRTAEPWVVALAGAAGAAALVSLGVAALFRPVALAYVIAAALGAALLVYLWVGSVSTKRAYIEARSIYAKSKEQPEEAPAPQKPWLGLPQWLGIVAASVAAAIGNSLLRGHAPSQIPALEVILDSSLLIGVTAVVCAVPATAYWVSRKAWMPELTRFAWLAWIVVSFAFTYGNYLTSLDRV